MKRPKPFTEKFALFGIISVLVIVLYWLTSWLIWFMPASENYNQKMHPTPTINERLKMLESGVNTFEGTVYEVDGGFIIRSEK
jgi:hypothetical protein